MANQTLTPTMITRKALMILHQKCNFIGSINRQYDDRFARSGAKIGDTLQVRKPVQYTVRSGKTIDVQDSEETKVDLTVGTQKGVDIEFSSEELTLDIDDFADRFLEPAMAVLAANIESDAFSMVNDIYNIEDNSTSSTTAAHVLDVNKKLTDNLCPRSQRVLNMSTQQMVDLVTDTKGLFNDQQKISSQYRDGLMGQNTLGYSKIMENTLIPRLSHGAADGDYDVNGAVTTEGATSVDVDTGTGAAVAGQTFTISGVNRVHPETKNDTGELQQFVLTQDFSGGTGTINFSPAVYSSGAKQNVSQLPQDGSDITFLGTASEADDQSIAYHPNAFTFVSADLEVPKGVDFARRETYDGISMRLVRDYDVTNDEFPCRIDVLYGYKTLREELACRLYNN